MPRSIERNTRAYPKGASEELNTSAVMAVLAYGLVQLLGSLPRRSGGVGPPSQERFGKIRKGILRTY